MCHDEDKTLFERSCIMSHYRVAISGENSMEQLINMLLLMKRFMEIEEINPNQEIMDMKTGETVYTVHVIDVKAVDTNFYNFKRKLEQNGHELTLIGDTYFM
jgi:hypothetical protein